MYEKVKEYFRYPTYRPGQEESLVETAEALDAGKKYVIAQLPTGLGKSDIAMALLGCATERKVLSREHLMTLGTPDFQSAAIKRGYVVTSQKILQDQYEKEFDLDGYFQDVRGRANYTCKMPRSIHEDDCDSNRQHCPYANGSDCAYKHNAMIAKEVAVASSNTKYFAMACQRWENRVLTVIDEAHNVPDEVLQLVDFTITDRFLEKCLLFDYIYDAETEYDGGENPRLVHMGEFIGWIQSLEKPIDNALEVFSEQTHLSDEDEKTQKRLADLHGRVLRFLSSVEHTDWICEVEFRKGGERVFTARPLYPGFFAPDMFLKHSNQTFLQSATIVDPAMFAKEIGLTPDEFHYVERPSPFKASHRPVFNMDKFWMNQKSIESSTPLLIKEIQRILKAFPEHKGIIHCHTYKLQQEIAQALNDGRIITHDKFNKADAIANHVKSSHPTVLLSPSLTEGLDLKGPLARFSIICKLPFPYRGDRRTRKRIERDAAWEMYQTAKTLVQAVGRGVRSEDDWCYTFVMDKAFNRFLRTAPLPKDFTNSVASRSLGEKIISRG